MDAPTRVQFFPLLYFKKQIKVHNPGAESTRFH